MAKVEKSWSWDEDKPEPDYESIAEVEWEWESWQFDMTRVYRQKSTGDLFYAEDSGCSCPSPFEDTEDTDLTPIERMQDWYDHVASRVVERTPDQDDYQYPRPTPAESIDQAHRAGTVVFDALRARK